jgi:hypothetical protein
MLHSDNIHSIIIENSDHNEILKDINTRFWDLFDILLRDPDGISSSSYDVLCGLGYKISPYILAEKRLDVGCSIDNRYYIRENQNNF